MAFLLCAGLLLYAGLALGQPTPGLPAGVNPAAARALLQSQGIGPSDLNSLQNQLGTQPASPMLDPNAPANLNTPRTDDKGIGVATGPEPPLTTSKPGPGSFAYFVMQATGSTVPTFGEDLFSRSNTFAALESQPVPADYSIGPGDEIIMKVFGGAVDFDQRLVVDRSGMILLPKIGPVSVAGVKVRDLESTLKTQIGKFLRDFSLFASLGSLRGIEVYVVGQARAPGKYVVSSVSTLINALFATGGPGANGSMRQIELVRNSKVVASVDLYDFIIKGDTSKDVRLLPGDVINIPPAGPRVALTGGLPRNAIFELSPAPASTSLGEIVRMAGGLSAATDRLAANLTRSQPDQIRALTAVALSLDDVGLKTPMRDGDIVTLYPIKNIYENAIHLVVRDNPPVTVPIAHGDRVSNVITSKDLLIPQESWQRQRASESLLNFIRGQSSQNLINWDQAIIERLEVNSFRTKIISFSLREAIERKAGAVDPLLLPGDIVTIFSASEVAIPVDLQTRVVLIEGEVKAPGIYEISSGDTLIDLLTRAGGFTANAYVFGLEFTRESVRAQQQKSLDQIVDRLESGLLSLRASSQVSGLAGTEVAAARLLEEQNRTALQRQINRLKALNPKGRMSLGLDPRSRSLPQLALENGDTIRVPTPAGSVSAIGSVFNESAQIFRPGGLVTEYLEGAGVSDSAEVERTFVVRADGSLVSPTFGRSLLASLNPFSAGRDVLKMELMPGDVIVVPEKFSQETAYSVFMRGLKDWTQVLYQLGLAAAAVHTLQK